MLERLTRPFTEHPRDAGETYVEHMGVASRVGWKMLQGAALCFVHALFPFLAKTGGSDCIRALYREIGPRSDRALTERLRQSNTESFDI